MVCCIVISNCQNDDDSFRAIVLVWVCIIVRNKVPRIVHCSKPLGECFSKNIPNIKFTMVHKFRIRQIFCIFNTSEIV